jgi:rusticyanin
MSYSYSYHGYAGGYAGSAGGSGGSGSASGNAQNGFSSATLARSIATRVGTGLAGKAPQTVSTSQAQTLANQVPAGARLNRSADTITFTGATDSFTVVAVPPGGPDMSFRVAGLNNPAIVLPKGARVTVTFINADTDEAHGWLVTSEQPPFTFGQSHSPAIAGAYADIIGDPTSAGDGAESITFQATAAGTYEYLCPMPGHAQMGMHGKLIVR